ncbi:prepilin peptidase [Pseudooceanicola sp. MF1-13]|uniref:prepilin peptidase n=1 Tax=Pseudooceanicola sp. MF1-13 TaxID=3379095 RepID=UPI003892744E
MTHVEILATVPLALALIHLARIDIKQRILPDIITLPLVVAGLGLSLLDGPEAVITCAIGAAAGFAIFFVIGEVFFRLRGYEGLGLGDAKLFSAAGAWLGWAALPTVLLIASLGALGYIAATGWKSGRAIAFGPWLCFGFFVSWCLKLI